MAAVAVCSKTIDPTARGAILTFVVPTADGCGMHCPYCFIAQRKEPATRTDLSPEHYMEFIRGAAARHKIAAVTVQGYEPLAPDSRIWTDSILTTAREFGAEIGLVTNGLFLSDSLALLQRLDGISVTVSLDAAEADEHDRLRRRIGSWQKAVDGIRLAVLELPTGSVIVNSVLFPGKADRLLGLPAILARLGVRRWSVSPLIQFFAGGLAVMRGQPTALRRDFDLLAKAATVAGIQLIADDEFGLLDLNSDTTQRLTPEVTVRTLLRPDGLLRLNPDGRCASGLDVLREHDETEYLWQSGMDVTIFLDRCGFPAQLT